MEWASKEVEVVIIMQTATVKDMCQTFQRKDTSASDAKKKAITFMTVQKIMIKTTTLPTKKVSQCLKSGDARQIGPMSSSRTWIRLWNLSSKI